MATSFDVLRDEHTLRLESELPHIVEALKALGAEFVLLFGSYAAGRRDLFTDLDILVVMQSDLPFAERMVDVYRKVERGVEADILVYTPEEFARIKHRRFFRNALNTGKVLYGTT